MSTHDGQIKRKLGRFLLGDDGPTSVEYAVLLAGIIIVCISAITVVGGETFNYWQDNLDSLEGVLP